jgi:ketosteroid isomerase-like protein
MAAEPASVATVRAFYAGFESSDYAPAVRALLAEDAVWHMPGTHPLAGEHRGIEAILNAMRGFDGSVQLELHDVVGNDEHAVALLRARGERRGRSYDALEVDIFHVRDGRITEFWSFSEDQRKTDAYWAS